MGITDTMSDKMVKRDDNISRKPNNIPVDVLFDKFIDLYFKQKNIMFTHMYNSFDKLLDEDIPNFLKNEYNNLFWEKITKDKIYRYKFKYEDISIKPPFLPVEEEIMFPKDARLKSMTYCVNLVATVSQVQEVINIADGSKKINISPIVEKECPVATIPLLVRSKYCATNLKKEQDSGECRYDPGGYFIVSGSEKVVMSQEYIIENRPLVFLKKDSSSSAYVVQVNSKSRATDMVQLINIRQKKDNTLVLKVPILNEVHVFTILRAIGIESDKDIINLIVYDKKDTDMINIIRDSLEKSKSSILGENVITQNEAIQYLMTKMRVVKKYNETDPVIREIEKRKHLEQLLKDNFLPHVEGGLYKKAFYLGYMINRLLNVSLGRIPLDDRDSFINKRVNLVGPLIMELFKQFYKKMLNDCGKSFKRKNQNDDEPFNVIGQIKPNIIEQGLKTALSTGAWGKRKGVAQMLNRLTYNNTTSSLRKIISPTVDASNNKLTGPRHLHPTVLGPICFIETPEGSKVGLVKHMSLIGNVTVIKSSQYELLKGILKNMVTDIQVIPPEEYYKYTRVLLNGEIIGMTDSPRETYYKLKKMKYENKFDPRVSVTHDIRSELESKDIRIYCDSGRIFHPMIRVEDNKLKLTMEMLDNISVNNTTDSKKISSWDEFMLKYPGVIEYLDSDERYNSMSAITQEYVEKMRLRMDESKNKVLKLDESQIKYATNRYDDFTYVKYTHCEIHPSLLIGTVVSNTPFPECNQGPRNIFQYSQAKQAMGIYATNWRDRLDISYILYHPQTPIVFTKNAKYTNSDMLPAGENTIVAIACYGGYNQEDSNFMNKTSVERGLFRSINVRKIASEIKKNQSTSQDDVFIKPDKTLVSGMKGGNYDKLNEKGYAPEGTYLENNDIVIGKISPIKPTDENDTKIYKDSSEIYKSNEPGVIDKVYYGIQNNDGYGMVKIRTRSERTPIIGDKFCSREGQKGTCGVLLSAADMPFTEGGVMPDIIINPHAMPSRMTVGQLIECLQSKYAAITYTQVDGTAFTGRDLDKVKQEMKKHGYDQNGYEYMYNGMTGKKMEIPIFIGPTYYQRLKHMVADKIHSRSRGPITLLTRQPPEGRSREGGLKFGEMERDCMISHGMSRFLKERFLETADLYTTFVCDECGLFAQRNKMKGYTVYATKNDVYHCPACRNKTNISKVRIPYAFKLLLQELMSMNIAPRIRTRKLENFMK